MSDEEHEGGEQQSVRVNFGRPIPLFPLDDAVLLPNAVLPLHIFEPRYRQMISDALSGSGQFALAVFEGDRWREEYHGRPPLRPAVCIARIVQHERLPDGRYNVLVQGVCRARIDEEATFDAERRLYREARLSPIGPPGAPGPEARDDAEDRERLRRLLACKPLRRFVDPQGNPLARGLANYLDRPAEEAATPVIVDLVGQYLVKAPEVKYRLLAEGDAAERVRIVERELRALASLIRRADLQIDPAAPKGVSWN